MSQPSSSAAGPVRLEPPTDDLTREVQAIVAEATAADGVAPLSEQVELRLRHHAPEAQHAVARSGDGALAGYLQLVEEAGTTTAELVVAPLHRRRGVGTALARWAVERSGGGAEPSADAGRLRVWAHGNGVAAAALARRLAFRPTRVLLQMRRPADVPLPAPDVPTGVRIRTFRPGIDDEAWVAVNGVAFASHPEQGRVTVADLRERMAEAWFDPDGFFVAEHIDTARLVGFHWTKVHEAPERLGEIYVVGIDPAERGTGLGVALTITGLRHLVATGVPTLMLYADESNAGAVRMYDRLGFTIFSTDVTYERTSA